MSKKDEKIIVHSPNDGWYETDKESFKQGMKGLQELSKNISKYGIVDGLDPSYRRNAKTASFARIFMIISIVIVVILLGVLVILSSAN